jgi:integrase
VGTRDEDDAQRVKAKIEAQLLLGLDAVPQKRTRGPNMRWNDFRDDYSRLKLVTLRDGVASSTENRIDVCERIVKPRTLADMARTDRLETLKVELLAGVESQSDFRSPHTVNSYLRALVAALNWAHKQGWLPKRVPVQDVAADDPDKGRPLVGEEFERMLAACDKVCGQAADSWRYLLRGMWESGLRVSEAMNLSFDIDGTIQVVRERRGVVLVIPGRKQKNRRHQVIPTIRAFTELLNEHPTQTGWVFTPSRRNRDKRMAISQVKRVISDIGERAAVIVNQGGKFASAHDLRRSFGQRLANSGVYPRDLQKIMRHASITTTETYYLNDNAHDIGERINSKVRTCDQSQLATERCDSVERGTT